MGVLDGNAGIITGAARGSGKGMATALAKEGMAVTLTDVRADTVEETAAGLRALGLQAQGVVADVAVGMDSGFWASFRYMKACFPYLRESQGTVVNFGSQAGLLGNWGEIGYNASKEAIRALTRTAAREWSPYNITVNNIILGMLTEGSKELFDQFPEHMRNSLANIPMGRLGDPEKECGALAVFLATPGAHYITGDTFNIDGGRCLRP